MVQTNPVQAGRVSPSMIRSVFSELKANGYSDNQVVALSAGLMELASTKARSEQHLRVREEWESESELADDGNGSAEGLALLGYPEEFEALCTSGLPLHS